MESRYENLRVYKKALELVVYFENTVRGFDRYHKYTVGEDLRNLSRSILVLIAKANTKTERKQCLESALEKLEELKILIHVCKEIKAFHSFSSFEFVTKSIVDISKQCEGWLKSQNVSSKPLGAVR
jgi:four helix bundle protein